MNSFRGWEGKKDGGDPFQKKKKKRPVLKNEYLNVTPLHLI